MKSAVEKVRAILHGKAEEKVCSSPLQTCTLELMGLADTYWPQAHSDPAMMAKLSSMAYETAGVQGLRIPFDICVEAEAIGCDVRMGKADAPPSIMSSAFAEFDEVKIPATIMEKGRIPTVLRAAKLLRERYGHSLPLYTMMVGPLTLLGFLVGIEKTLYTLSTEPDKLRDALDTVLQFNIDYAGSLFAEGDGILLICDPVASGDLLAAEHFVGLVLPYYQRIRRQIRAQTILHICGNSNPLLRHLPEAGFEGFSFHGPEVGVKNAKKAIGDKMALVGNIPVATTLRYSSPSTVRRRSLDALRDGVDILAPSCGFHPLTPVSNMKAMVRAIADHESKNRS